jgi:ankyrin repeat protein
VNTRRDVDNGTPLYLAAYKGRKEVVRVLLDAGADTDQASTIDHGATPLFASAQNGNVEVVRALVEAGANIDLAETTNGATPLYVSTQNGHVEVVDGGRRRTQGL